MSVEHVAAFKYNIYSEMESDNALMIKPFSNIHTAFKQTRPRFQPPNPPETGSLD